MATEPPSKTSNSEFCTMRDLPNIHSRSVCRIYVQPTTCWPHMCKTFMFNFTLDGQSFWKSKKRFWLVCVWARACLWLPGSVGVCMLVSACSLAYPAYNAYAPYCEVIFDPSFSTIFSDIISQTEKFSEKIIEHKICVLIFYTTLF